VPSTSKQPKRVLHRPTQVQGITYGINAKGRKVFTVWYCDPLSGKRRSETVGPDFARAKARLRELQHKSERGEVIGDPTITVGQLAERWFEFVQARLKPKSVKSYQHSYRRHVAPRWARVKAREVSRIGIQQWLLGLQRHDGLPLDAETKNLALSVWTGILDVAIEMEAIAGNPCRSLPRGSKPKRTKLKPRILQPGELQRLLAASPEWLADVIRVTYLAGLRAGEACGLTWQQIDWERNVIVVDRQLGQDMEVGTPKGGVGEVVLLPELKRLLLELRNRRGAVPHPTAPVLTAATSRGFINPSVLSDAFIRARNNAGLGGERPFRFHDLRHSIVSQLANNPAIAPVEVRDFARHKSLKMTEGYIHTVTSVDRAERFGVAAGAIS
jgi:integrase